jgi:type I restriction enzyme S subunit
MNVIAGWFKKRFDEIGTIYSGSTPSTSVQSFWDGDIVWVTPNDLSKLNTPYLSNSNKHITTKGLEGCSAHLLPPGSIVMSSRAPIGYVAIPTVEFCTNQGSKSIELKDGFDTEFAYYNILFNIEKVKNLGEGTTFAEISKTALSKVELDFPISKPEQTKIAEILSTVDRAIEQTEALIAKQQCIKTGLMQDLLTRGIDKHGNLRSGQTHKFKDSSLGRIPMDWEVELLDVLATRGSGHTPNKRRPEYWNGGIKWVSLSDSSKLDQGLIVETDKEISALGLKHSSAVMHSKGTVILSRDAGVGKSAILGENMAVSQHFMAWRCKPAILDNYYLYYWLQKDKPKFEGIASGSTIVTIGLQFFREYRIAAPRKVSEQKQISETLNNADRSLEQSYGDLGKLRRLKTALMQDLLTGKKRVTSLLNNTEVPA